LKGCGTILSKRRLRWSNGKSEETRRVVTRTYPYLVRKIRVEVKDRIRVRERVRS